MLYGEINFEPAVYKRINVKSTLGMLSGKSGRNFLLKTLTTQHIVLLLKHKAQDVVYGLAGDDAI